MAEPFPAPPSVIDRQTARPKAEAWQVHDEGAIVSLDPDRSRAAEVLPSNLRSVSSGDPSNPTAGPTHGSATVSRGALSAYVRPVSSFDPDDLGLPREDESGRRVAIRMCF